MRDLTERRPEQKAKAKAQADASPIEQLEQEFRSLERFFRPPGTLVTAQLYGAAPLHRSFPDIFDELVKWCGRLMDLILEERAYNINIPEKLSALAEQLGLLKAGPGDLINIYIHALDIKTRGASPEEFQAYVREGRLMVLELMGYLVSFYRHHASPKPLEAREIRWTK